MLPLKRGIYVDSAVPCRGASNADMMSYWGGRNGINISKRACTIDRLSKRGNNYALHRTCREIIGGGTFKGELVVKIMSRARFAVEGRSFRYCGPKVQF